MMEGGLLYCISIVFLRSYSKSRCVTVIPNIFPFRLGITGTEPLTGNFGNMVVRDMCRTVDYTLSWLTIDGSREVQNIGGMLVE